jgi:long-chain acyl-CoA synthetase
VTESIARSIVDYPAVHAGRGGGKAALVCEDQSLSYGALTDLSARCRGLFGSLGLQRGDRVALLMCDCPEWIIAFLGVTGLGAIAVPCSTMSGAKEISSILNDCGARMVVITTDQCETMHRRCPRLKRRWSWAMFRSSGG